MLRRDRSKNDDGLAILAGMLPHSLVPQKDAQFYKSHRLAQQQLKHTPKSQHTTQTTCACSLISQPRIIGSGTGGADQNLVSVIVQIIERSREGGQER